MTIPILNFSANQASGNPLLSQSDIALQISSSLTSTFTFKEWDNITNYLSNDIVHYYGFFYKALSNINLGLGIPTALATWERTNRLRYITRSTAGATTTLTGTSEENNFFTGSTTQTIALPVVSTLSLGRQFFVFNKSTGIITVQSSGLNTISTIGAGQYGIFTCILITGSGTASWAFDVGVVSGGSPTFTNVTTTGNIELGNATDTTISRVSAGAISIEGVNVVTTSSTDTLTNKTFGGPVNGSSDFATTSDAYFYSKSGGAGVRAGHFYDGTNLKVKSFINAVAITETNASGLIVTGLLDLNTASSGQIKFPSTQNASSNANTLDDYEEGTWTPVLKFGAGTTGITYSVQNGYYRKIGGFVSCRAFISLTSKGSSTGTATLTGLPFTSINQTNGTAPASTWFQNITYTGSLYAYVPQNDTVINIQQMTEAGTLTNKDDTSFSNTSGIMINLNYEVA